jgi:hypothetical protein
MNIEKSQNEWQPKVFKNNPTFPFLVIDNWYNVNEEKAIWKELELYTTLPKDKIDRAENTVVAKDRQGKPKSNAFRFYVDGIYTNEGKKYSPILNCLYKLSTEKFDSLVNECKPYCRSFFSANQYGTLVSYYENDDHYEAHYDSCQWTLCVWFVKDRELFTGGDFYLPESNNLIKLKHNRAVFFPSCFLHKVTPVKFNKEPETIGYGRFTITTFLNFVNDGTIIKRSSEHNDT